MGCVQSESLQTRRAAQSAFNAHGEPAGTPPVVPVVPPPPIVVPPHIADAPSSRPPCSAASVSALPSRSTPSILPPSHFASGAPESSPHSTTSSSSQPWSSLIVDEPATSLPPPSQ